MGVGHAAVALGASRASPRLNAGWLVFGTFLADFLLGIFATAGLEQAHVPADFASRHYLTFTFPYSHGLVPLLLWGGLFGYIVSRAQRLDQRRAFLVLAAVVAGAIRIRSVPASPKLGLALWDHMPLELSIETLMAGAGAVLYVIAAGAGAPRASRWGIPVFMTLLTGLTWTQLFMTTPPVPAQLAVNWMAAPLVFGVVVYTLDRKRARGALG